MRNKSLILFGTLLFSSCLYKAWYNFEGDDLAWMEPYKERDTVVFASSSGMDTMIVNKVTLNNSHPLFVPNEGTSVYNANGYIESIMFHNKAHYECELTIVKRKDDLMEVYLLFKERALMFVNQNELHLTNVVVNGIEYDDAVIVDDSNSAPRHNARYCCDYFIWSKSKGLLEYKYHNGEVYTFYKKLPYKRKD